VAMVRQLIASDDPEATATKLIATMSNVSSNVIRHVVTHP